MTNTNFQNKYQATEIAIEAGHGTGFCIGNIPSMRNVTVEKVHQLM